MQLVITIEYRFHRTPDGMVWAESTFPYSYWTRYLAVFERVKVVARVSEVASVPETWRRANGEGVEFTAVPHYIGPYQYFAQQTQINRVIRESVEPGDAVLMRVPSQIAVPLHGLLATTGHPYGLEVVGDPYDALAPGAIVHPLRPLFRQLWSAQMRRQCKGSSATAYVTESKLQCRYPTSSDAFTTHYSSVELPETALVLKPRFPQPDKITTTLVSVATMTQLYKGLDVLLEAVAVCIQKQLDVRLVLVGDGKYRNLLEIQAQKLGISPQVHFLGQLSTFEAVCTQLDQADIFVLPSKTEGLPRALIEAMARALPCIGTTVGGIPELLSDDDMVAPGNVDALANKICEVAHNPERLSQMSMNNLEKAKEYIDPVLRKRRNEFYHHLQQNTRLWIQKLT